jgi:hypothetical protein
MYTMVVTKLNLSNVIHIVNQLMQYPSNMEHWMVTKNTEVLAKNTTSECNIEEIEMK